MQRIKLAGIDVPQADRPIVAAGEGLSAVRAERRGVGASGVAGDGKKIVCEDNNGWRWEPV